MNGFNVIAGAGIHQLLAQVLHVRVNKIVIAYLLVFVAPHVGGKRIFCQHTSLVGNKLFKKPVFFLGQIYWLAIHAYPFCFRLQPYLVKTDRFAAAKIPPPDNSLDAGTELR